MRLDSDRGVWSELGSKGAFLLSGFNLTAASGAWSVLPGDRVDVLSSLGDTAEGTIELSSGLGKNSRMPASRAPAEKCGGACGPCPTKRGILRQVRVEKARLSCVSKLN